MKPAIPGSWDMSDIDELAVPERLETVGREGVWAFLPGSIAARKPLPLHVNLFDHLIGQSSSLQTELEPFVP